MGLLLLLYPLHVTVIRDRAGKSDVPVTIKINDDAMICVTISGYDRRFPLLINFVPGDAYLKWSANFPHKSSTQWNSQ
jgi:hypothetical protein